MRQVPTLQIAFWQFLSVEALKLCQGGPHLRTSGRERQLGRIKVTAAGARLEWVLRQQQALVLCGCVEVAICGSGE